MKDEVRARLNQLFAEWDRAAALERLSQQQRQSLEIDALRDFHIMCRETIRPVMQEFVDLLAARGIKAEITTTVEDLTEEKPLSTASIKFGVLTNPAHAKRAFDVPGFTVVCDKGHRTVRFHQSTIGRATPGAQLAREVGYAGFDAVSADSLQEQIAAFITALYT